MQRISINGNQKWIGFKLFFRAMDGKSINIVMVKTYIKMKMTNGFLNKRWQIIWNLHMQ